MSRLKDKYAQEIVPVLMERFSIGNVNQAPRLRKITVNMGVGKAIENAKRIEAAQKDLALITGQFPMICRAKKSISNFKLRQGQPVGVKSTLRGDRMYEFLDRMISVVIPRIRDFRGFKKKLDGRGNYTLGLEDQIVFPEINIDRVDFVQGMDICMTIDNANDEQGGALLEGFGFPFRKN